jgi:cell division septal protein FtsQ
LAAAAGILWAAAHSGLRPQWKGFSLKAPASPGWSSVEAVEVSGAPESLREPFLRGLGWEAGMRWGGLEPYRAARRLRAAFPCLRDVRVRRSWKAHAARFEVTLKQAEAAVVRSGRRGEYLDAQGRVFSAPEGVYVSSSLPVVEIVREPAEQELREAMRLFKAAGETKALPARIVRLCSAAGGWTATAADGATLAWGKMEWTQEKIIRLAEVYADATARFGAPASADLRHFSEGRIFVKPR